MGENAQVIIGPCKCGGYGLCYNEETEKELGKCHETLEELLKKAREKNNATNL